MNAAPCLAAVIYILLLLSQLLDAESLGENPYLTVIILQLLVFARPALFFCRLRGKNYSARIRVRLFEPGCIPFIILLSVTLMLASCAVKLGLYRIFDYTLEVTDIYEAYIPAQGGGAVLFTALAFAVFPAITEELVFRGMMLAEYEDCGVPAAVIYSSLLFSMLHFDLKLFPVYFISGLILAFSAYVCRSLLAPICIHTVNNIFSLFFEDYIWNSILQPRNIVIFFFIITALLLIFLTLSLGEAGRIYKYYGRYGTQSSYVRTKSERIPAVYAVMTIPFAVCLVIFVFTVLL